MSSPNRFLAFQAMAEDDVDESQRPNYDEDDIDGAVDGAADEPSSEKDNQAVQASGDARGLPVSSDTPQGAHNRIVWSRQGPGNRLQRVALISNPYPMVLLENGNLVPAPYSILAAVKASMVRSANELDGDRESPDKKRTKPGSPPMASEQVNVPDFPEMLDKQEKPIVSLEPPPFNSYLDAVEDHGWTSAAVVDAAAPPGASSSSGDPSSTRSYACYKDTTYYFLLSGPNGPYYDEQSFFRVNVNHMSEAQRKFFADLLHYRRFWLADQAIPTWLIMAEQNDDAAISSSKVAYVQDCIFRNRYPENLPPHEVGHLLRNLSDDNTVDDLFFGSGSVNILDSSEEVAQA